ncbi:MAG: hypothetical protein GX947_10635 [Tissierellia bacterium]|nr:hypothetical protein [Tissierellia bacterium]
MAFFDLKAECVICKSEVELNRYQIRNKDENKSSVQLHNKFKRWSMEVEYV